MEGHAAVMPNCWIIAEALLLLLLSPSHEEDGSKCSKSLDEEVRVGEGEREELSWSRVERPSFASWATNIAKSSSAA